MSKNPGLSIAQGKPCFKLLYWITSNGKVNIDIGKGVDFAEEISIGRVS